MTTDDRRATWETYTSAWKVADAKEKFAALRASVDGGAVYRDPLTQAEGHGALIEYMLRFHQQVPGGHFETTYFQTHHNRSIAKWTMRDGQDVVIGDGVSYAEYGSDGKLVTMNGFFETPPQ